MLGSSRQRCLVSCVSLLPPCYRAAARPCLLTNLCPAATALFARRDPRLLKVPPYVSLLCILVGVAWLFMLPLDDHSRRTYISENALLPGQVHTYFGGSDQNVLRAYRHEVTALENSTNTEYVMDPPSSSADRVLAAGSRPHRAGYCPGRLTGNNTG